MIKELKKTVVPVRADNPDDAQKIFDQWYHKHTDAEPQDSTILDLLDNGYEGREISRSAGIPEDEYDGGNVMLPEEGMIPEEPLYGLRIRFADGSQPYNAQNLSLATVAGLISSYSQKYFLFPDGGDGGNRLMIGYSRYFWLYAVLKDQPETWYEFGDGKGSFHE